MPGPSTESRKVKLDEVNTKAIPYPMALGRDNAGCQYVIDLTDYPPGLLHVPEKGEWWWIEHKTTRWTLAKLAEDDQMKDMVPGQHFGLQLEHDDLQVINWMNKL